MKEGDFLKKSTKRFILIAIIVILAIIVISVFSYLKNRTHFNNADVSGNIGGNYYNSGLFCEHNDTVYFANPYDDYALYKMTPQGTNAEKLSSDKVSFINADNHYIYYVRDNISKSHSGSSLGFIQQASNGLCRINHNGKDTLLLDADPSLYAALSGNYIYYIHYDKETASTLYKVKIDATEKQKVDASPLLLSPAANGTLCYNGVSGNHNIWSFNASNDGSSLLYEGNCWNPIDDGSYIYFMDCENDYHLTRIAKNGQEKTDLSQCRVDCYNVYGDYVYYEKNDINNDIHMLCRKSLSPSGEEEVVAEGVFCDINITSNYVYFRNFNNQDEFFQTPTTGAIDVEPFSFETK